MSWQCGHGYQSVRRRALSCLLTWQLRPVGCPAATSCTLRAAALHTPPGCVLQNHVPIDSDIVITEFATNDAQVRTFFGHAAEGSCVDSPTTRPGRHVVVVVASVGISGTGHTTVHTRAGLQGWVRRRMQAATSVTWCAIMCKLAPRQKRGGSSCARRQGVAVCGAEGRWF